MAVAAVGFVVGEQFHPLFGGDIDIPSYLAFQQTPLQTFWPIVVLGIGLFEKLTSIPAFEKPVNGDATTNWKIRADHVPGDAGLFGGKQMAVCDLLPSTAYSCLVCRSHTRLTLHCTHRVSAQRSGEVQGHANQGDQ